MLKRPPGLTMVVTSKARAPVAQGPRLC